MLHITILLFAISVVKVDSVQDGYYTAAVYEHVRLEKLPHEEDLPKIIEENLMVYEQVTSAAKKKGADIVVFPESGLNPKASRAMYREYAEYIPDPHGQTWIPCEMEADYLIANNLSCTAKRHNVYLVANLISKQPCSSDDPDCPKDKVYLYNTNVVFNRNGQLVARYHKYHLFFERNIDIPKTYEYVVFETEFATIGTFICFDIMWKPSAELLKKYKIDTVVFPFFWIEGLPMFSSLQVASSWALENDVNLLAANAQRPSTGAVGSGIFLAASRTAHYVYKPNGKPKLIIAKIPIRGSNNTILSDEATVIEFENPTIDGSSKNTNTSGECSKKILGPPKTDLDFRCLDMDLSNFTLVKFQKDRNTAGACNNGLCCLVKYDAVDMDEDYYLAVSNATLYILNYYGIWVETCMVIRCDQYNGTKCSTFPTLSNTVFRGLSMKANITSEHVYPSVLTSGMQLLSPDMWSYANGTLSLKTSDGLLFAVMNGRPYDRDPPYPRH